MLIQFPHFKAQNGKIHGSERVVNTQVAEHSNVSDAQSASTNSEHQMKDSIQIFRLPDEVQVAEDLT